MRQLTTHPMKPMSLTSCKVKEEANSSAHATYNEYDITYILEGKEGE